MQNIFYCEMEYWNHLFRILEERKNIFDEGYEKNNCACNMFKAICRSSELKFDDIEEFNKSRIKQPCFRRLVDRSENVNGSLSISCENFQKLPDISEDSFSSFFLLESHEKDALQKGVMAINIETTTNNSNLYKDFGWPIAKKEQASWKDLLKDAKHNCNSMLMFDLYILKKKEENLYLILDILLPNRLENETGFDLSIFTSEKIDMQQEYDKICAKLKTIKPNLKVNFSMFYCSSDDFHDRAILTNYLWIGCGAGFDLFKKDRRGFHNESEKSTKVSIYYPKLQQGINGAEKIYDVFINDAKRIKKNSRHIGSGENRLLSS